MNKALELIVREMNPVHDLDRVGYSPSIFSGRIELAKDFYRVINTTKHTARGIVLGWLGGGLIGLIAGEPGNHWQWATVGAEYGSWINVSQYFARCFFYQTGKDALHYLQQGYGHVRRLARRREIGED